MNEQNVLQLEIRRNERICDEHFRLSMTSPLKIAAKPGQFLQLRCRKAIDTHDTRPCNPAANGLHDNDVSPHWSDGPVLLPRPFSLAGCRVRDDGVEIEIIGRVVGRGTAWLAGLRPGDRIGALGPLGNGFAIPKVKHTIYLVGGGCGLPPLIWLAGALRDAGHNVVAFCGARTARLLPLRVIGDVPTRADVPAPTVEEFSIVGTPAVLTTDDGSLGVRGLVSTAMEHYHTAHPAPRGRLSVYTCGPEAMMRSVARWCASQNVPCQVCMERLMACGIGTCQSCVVPIRKPDSNMGFTYKLCCKDGPVFDARDVVWD